MIRKVPRLQRHKVPEAEPDNVILLKNPLKQFRLWYEFARKSGEFEPEAMALATADDKGRPSVRMVLFKDVARDGLGFFTNYESRKSIHLRFKPYASLLFY